MSNQEDKFDFSDFEDLGKMCIRDRYMSMCQYTGR